MLKKVFLVSLILCLCLSLVFPVSAEEEPDFEELTSYLSPRVYDQKTVTFADMMALVGTVSQGDDPLYYFFEKLFDDGVLRRTWPKDSVFTVEETVIRNAFEALYGPDSFAPLKGKDLVTWGYKLEYLAAEKRYLHVRAPDGGGVNSHALRTQITEVKKDGENRLVYVAFGLFRYEKGRFEILDNFPEMDKNPPQPFTTGYETEEFGKVWDMYNGGQLDEYLPLYCHTFKPNGKGGYYWASTHMEKAATPIPEEMLPSQVESQAYQLLQYVPAGAYNTAGEMTVYNVPEYEFGVGPVRVLFLKLLDDGLIHDTKSPSSDPAECPDAPVFSEAEIKTHFENLFGPGSFASYADKDIRNVGQVLHYDSAKKTYTYVLSGGWGGGCPYYPYEAYEKVEKDGENLLVYVRYGTYGVSGETGKLWDFHYEGSSQERNPFSSGYDGDGEIFEKLKSGQLDEYLPLYCHTFKPNGNGGYYWASTRVAEAATPIPEELYPVKKVEVSTDDTEKTESNTDATPNTENSLQNTQSGENTGTERTPMWPIWVCVGVAVVALGCMFIPVILKKNRR